MTKKFAKTTGGRAAAKAYVRKTGKIVRLGNAHVELGFDMGRGGALVSVLDRKTDWQFVRDHAAPPALYRLALRDAGNKLLWIGHDKCKRLAWSQRRAVDGTTLVLEACPADAGRLSVHVEVTLPDHSPMSAWRIWVDGVRKDQAVHCVVCPVLSGFAKLGQSAPGETLVHPRHSQGALYRNPFPVVDGLPMRAGSGSSSPAAGIGKFGSLYPGMASMQFALYYNDHAGLYFACHDDQLNVKAIECGANDERHPAFFISHYPAEQRGQGCAIAYDTILGVFHGDWHDGAGIYREWAVKQWWCAKKQAQRKMPAWLRKGFAVWQMSNYHMPKIRLNHPIKKIAAEINALSKDVGIPFAGLVFNFEKDGAWTGPRGMFPPREGGKVFRDAMAVLRRKGNRGFLYVPGGQYYVSARFYDPPFDAAEDYAAKAEPSAVRKADGTAHTYAMIPKQVGDWTAARMCPATAYTRRMTEEMALGSFKLGADIVQVDNFPCMSPEACFDPAHGHPVGHGPWYTKAWIGLLTDIRRKAEAINPGCALTTEGVAECYIPFLDMYDMRGPNMELWHRGKSDPANGESIPLFGYVYGGYLVGYLAAFPECNRPEILYWTRCYGKALANGIIPTGGHYFPEPKAYNPVTLGFFKKVARAAARECWKYILSGRMLKPPQIQSPEIEAVYLPFASDFNAFDKDRPQFLRDTAIQHSRWLAEDGTVGHIMANVSREPVEFALKLEPHDGHRGPFRIRAVVDGKPRIIRRRQRLPHALKVRMEGLSVMLVELIRPHS